LPLAVGVVLTALDVMLVLLLQRKGFRLLEALVIALVALIGGCFLFEILLARPELAPLLGGFVPSGEIVRNPQMLYLAMGILGATVMPHNLYLHSSIVQTRRYEANAEIVMYLSSPRRSMF
jgi:manganese transport protein